MPLMSVVAFVLTVGLCSFDVNPLGPAQLYNAVGIVAFADNFNKLPARTGEFEPMMGFSERPLPTFMVNRLMQ